MDIQGLEHNVQFNSAKGHSEISFSNKFCFAQKEFSIVV